MSRGLLSPLLLSVSVAAPACMVDEAVEVEVDTLPQTIEVVGLPDEAVDDGRPRGVYVVQEMPELEVDHGVEVPDRLYAGEVIFYMNRRGGTFSPGNNDARVNRSSIVNGTVNIPAWDVSDSGWQQVMSCVRAMWAPYNVVITDVDPGNVPHFESVVAGRPGLLGLPANVGGVSPFTSDCSTIPNSIVYTFAEVYGTNYQAVCEVISQEVAHSFGLDHEYLCEDPMTYLGGCGDKTFQDVAAPCGEDGPRQCYCNGNTQNSVQMLLQRIGPAGDAALPSVNITEPADGATVAPGFIVRASASSNLAITKAELYIDGARVQELITPPFVFNASSSMAPGAHQVEVRATNSQGTSGDTITVNVSTDGSPGPGGDPDGGGPARVAGGCQVSSGASGGPALALLLLGVALAGARRRRRR